jgi:hypothetical protein
MTICRRNDLGSRNPLSGRCGADASVLMESNAMPLYLLRETCLTDDQDLSFDFDGHQPGAKWQAAIAKIRAAQKAGWAMWRKARKTG